MIADIKITEKSFGDKILMTGVKFGVANGEKVGVIGRNGVGKSTLFGILTGQDSDFTGEVIYKRGLTLVATAQEHQPKSGQTVLQYILSGLPEYAELSHTIETYPETMGDNMKKIEHYSSALERFEQKGFYNVESDVIRILASFQLGEFSHKLFASLSGGQKRLVEVAKVMQSAAQLALLDEPTNHMDFVAKRQFIDWIVDAPEAMLIITHDRDVLKHVDRIVELKDGGSVSYRGNYDAYLKQNAEKTSTGMHDHEMLERRKTNLRDKVAQFRRLKEKARDPDTIKQFKRREQQASLELAELEKIEKPTFWIDKSSVDQLDYKAAAKYDKYKARNIRMNFANQESRSKHVLVRAEQLSLGYDAPLFSKIEIDLREGEAVELRGRNGAGKSTLIKALLADKKDLGSGGLPQIFEGKLTLDPQARVGVYEQEVSSTHFSLSLHDAIEKIYLDQHLSISEQKIRQLASDYLFTEADLATPVAKLSGGQKARLQIIQMLSNEPQLLVLDEPTNHLDLPSIEELEQALKKYTGAILYVSHDGYFRDVLGGNVLLIGGE